MKFWEYALIGVAIYEAVVGLSEITWVATGSTSLAAVASWPSLGSAVDPLIGTSANANYIEGGIDVATALAIWFFFLM